MTTEDELRRIRELAERIADKLFTEGFKVLEKPIWHSKDSGATGYIDWSGQGGSGSGPVGSPPFPVPANPAADPSQPTGVAQQPPPQAAGTFLGQVRPAGSFRSQAELDTYLAGGGKLALVVPRVSEWFTCPSCGLWKEWKIEKDRWPGAVCIECFRGRKGR